MPSMARHSCIVSNLTDGYRRHRCPGQGRASVPAQADSMAVPDNARGHMGTDPAQAGNTGHGGDAEASDGHRVRRRYYTDRSGRYAGQSCRKGSSFAPVFPLFIVLYHSLMPGSMPLTYINRLKTSQTARMMRELRLDRSDPLVE